MIESRYERGKEQINLFAEEVLLSNFIYAGIFYNYHEDYMEALAKVFHALVRNKGEKSVEALKDFLTERALPSPPATYLRADVMRTFSLRNLGKGDPRGGFYRLRDNSELKIYELKMKPASHLDKSSGLVFLKVKGYQDVVWTGRVAWEIKVSLMEEWLRLTENERVRNYIRDIRVIYDAFYGALREETDKEPFRKLAYYLFPIELYNFQGCIVVSKVALYKRRDETRKNFWKNIQDKLKNNDDLKTKKEDLIHSLEKRDKSWKEVENLLNQSLSDEWLEILRKDWKKFLRKCARGESQKLGVAFLAKIKEEAPPTLSYGFYRVPKEEIQLIVFAEKNFQLSHNGRTYSAKEVAERLEEEFSKFRFKGNCKITLYRPEKQRLKVYFIEDELFIDEKYFQIIRGDYLEETKSSNKLKNKDSLDLLSALAHFAVRMNDFFAVFSKNSHQNHMMGLLFLLNTDLEEEEEYLHWPYVRLIYEYFGVPVQTLTKRALTEILFGKEKNGVLKNTLISLYKNTKVLELRHSGFKLPAESTIYAIIERPSSGILCSQENRERTEKHYLYDIYAVHVQEKNATVRLEERIIQLRAMQDLGVENWLEKQIKDNKTKFLLVAATKESVLYELYNKISKRYQESRFLLARHQELKTAYFSDKVEGHCFVTYTSEMRKLLRFLGIETEKDAAVISIKPAHPKSIDDEMHHPALQLFFTEKVGWEREEVYSEQKNLFLFTLLALSMYESESFQTPFSKLSIQSRQRDHFLVLRSREKEYLFRLQPTLYELLKFVSKIPGKKENLILS